MKRLVFVLIFCAALCCAQPAFQSSGSCQSGSASCTTGNISTTIGQYILAACASDTNGTNVITVTDSASNTYTQLPNSPFKSTAGTSNFVWAGIWTSTASTTTATLTVTCHVTQTANWMGGIIGVYSTGGNALAVTNCVNTAPTTMSPGSFTTQANTTSTANQLIIGLWLLNAGNPTYTVGSGYTFRQQAGSNTGGISIWAYLEDKTVAATGAYTAGLSFTDGTNAQGGIQTALTLTNTGTCPGGASAYAHHRVASQ